MKSYKNKLKRFLASIGADKDENRDKLNEILNYQLTEILSDNKYFDHEKIKKLEKLLKDLLGTSLVEGIKIIESLNITHNILGDVCEFGVAQGKTSKLIAFLIQNSNKKFYLFDSFEGLPAPTKKDELKNDIFKLGKIENYEGKMAHVIEKVKNELDEIGFDKEKIIINKGFLNKDSINHMNLPKKVSFAYLDFDFYQPTLDSLNFLQIALNIGGIIIVDDYDFFSTGAKTATDEWFEYNSQSFQKKVIKTRLSSFIIIKRIK